MLLYSIQIHVMGSAQFINNSTSHFLLYTLLCIILSVWSFMHVNIAIMLTNCIEINKYNFEILFAPFALNKYFSKVLPKNSNCTVKIHQYVGVLQYGVLIRILNRLFRAVSLCIAIQFMCSYTKTTVKTIMYFSQSAFIKYHLGTRYWMCMMMALMMCMHGCIVSHTMRRIL